MLLPVSQIIKKLKNMNKDQDIYDNRGNRICKIVTSGNGAQNIFDTRGNRLGEYRPNENRTYDNRGNTVGSGNQLMRFLK